jgi:hypothetical protein
MSLPEGTKKHVHRSGHACMFLEKFAVRPAAVTFPTIGSPSFPSAWIL